MDTPEHGASETSGGNRYSHQYARPEKLYSDSKRFRFRMAQLFEVFCREKVKSTELGEKLEYELGVSVISHGGYAPYVNWERFFEHCELRDVLDTVTITYRFLKDERLSGALLGETKRFMKEECVGFTIDDSGGLHPIVDEAFEVNRQHLLEGLTGERFAAALDHCSVIDKAMLLSPIDGRQAIRSSFDLNENLFKTAFAGATHINSKTIEKHLKPAAMSYADTNGEVPHVIAKQVSGFENWVNSVHFFRHEAGRPEPMQPLEDTAILLVSQGYSYARWLLRVLHAG